MKIGYLIPEFPGQTHAFFMRERAQLAKRDVTALLYSTRPPANGMATHEWAESAASETTYLTPLKPRQLADAAKQLLRSGPLAWVRCLMLILQANDVSFVQRLKLMAMIPVAAAFAADANRKQWRHVHIHSCANAAWLGVFANRLAGIEYSLTLHGPLKDYGPNQHLKWKFAAFVIIITQDLLREATTELPAHCLPTLYLAPMGVDVDRFQRDSAYCAGDRDSTVRLVSCGRINRCKGHHDLIEAVRQLRQQGVDAKLRICGTTDSRNRDYLEQLESMIADNDLAEHVQLLGSVSEEAVRDELQEAQAFCLASVKEPLGVATMEAMAMEIPAIVTRSPGVSEMIREGVDGVLVEPGSPEAFVEQICELLDSPQTAIELGRNGRQTIVDRFSSSVSALRIMEGLGLETPDEPVTMETRPAPETVSV